MTKPQKFDPLAREAVDLAMELHASQLWKRFDSDDPVQIQLDSKEDILLCFVLGTGAEGFGLGLIHGPAAIGVFEGMRAGKPLNGIDALAVFSSLTFEPHSSLEPEYLEPHVAAQRDFAPHAAAPVFLTVDPDEGNYPMEGAGLGHVVRCLRCLLLADAQGLLRPRPWDARRRMLVLELQGEGAEAKVKDRVVSQPEQPIDWPQGPSPRPSWRDSLGPVRALEPIEATWVLGRLPLPFHNAQGEPGMVLLMLDADRGQALPPQIIESEPEELLGVALSRFLLYKHSPAAGKEWGGGFGTAGPGLPRRLVLVDEELAEPLEEYLDLIGIEFEIDTEREDWHRVAEGLVQQRSKAPWMVPDEELAEADPKSADHRLWVGAHLALGLRLVEQAGGPEALESEKHVKRFFGDFLAGIDLMQTHPGQAHWDAYTDWFLMHARSRKGARTKAELLRDKGKLPPILGAVLDSRLAAGLSVWRVAAVDPGALVTVENLLDGEQKDVHDIPLSHHVEVGLGMIARVFDVGEWSLCTIWGPLLGAWQIYPVLSQLQELGFDLDGDHIAGDLDQLGRLWIAMEAEAEAQPELLNSEGDPIVFLTGQFDIQDAARFRPAFEALANMKGDGEEHWAWLDDQAPGRSSDERSVLGNLEIMGNELLAYINSEDRLNRLRSLLEELPGLQFVGAHEPPEDELPDDEDGFDLSPEQEAFYADLALSNAMHWLDDPLPTLGDRSPREAYRLPKLRKEVLRLVRSMPDSPGLAGPIPAPRAELLAELERDAEAQS